MQLEIKKISKHSPLPEFNTKMMLAMDMKSVHYKCNVHVCTVLLVLQSQQRQCSPDDEFLIVEMLHKREVSVTLLTYVTSPRTIVLEVSAKSFCSWRAFGLMFQKGCGLHPKSSHRYDEVPKSF